MQLKEFTPKTKSVAIIGGGVAGATAAVHLAELGLQVTLLERGQGLVNGPPICHLHAGGNLYREISTDQCIDLLKQSIETVRLYPHSLNIRPTVIAVPTSDGGEPSELLPRLDIIKQCYQEFVRQDARNQVLGDPDDYYQLFSKEQLLALASREQPAKPQTIEEWLIPFAKHTDLEQLKYPVVAVQEYGWSVFRLASSAALVLDKLQNSVTHTGTEVYAVERAGQQWVLGCRNSEQDFELRCDYLINACGYETGIIDDMVSQPRTRLVEFKAAYVTHWDTAEQWPEVIFHGPRGTDKGMAQLTPYANGVFQLHGMTKDITLFQHGLVGSSPQSAQPKLPQHLEDKIKHGWPDDERLDRTNKAIAHMQQFIPSYQTATEQGKPLFGAQQIPGEDDTLRAADVTFADHNYARIEIVKGSSALEAARKIVEQWQLFDYQERSIESLHPSSMQLTLAEVEQKAEQFALERQYPIELAKVYGQ
ncbi:FAD dependent oxidoreductase [Vibrio xiamenensis]|uniref:FAD dependent oxidoreductase n=1 Tax=Vibrio xiamenensis TaxID=861298 RepID=A0A1G7YWS6_9VIBR|nr:FAD-dependent oxidoreductase [Vibrio xiamenensis]SDH00699.1 FAD dependent oxidoreductase [Vibrio xiamenensis]